MPFDDFRIAFLRHDFKALMGPVPIELLTTALVNLPLKSRILDVRPIPGDGVSVEWGSHISFEDRQRVVEAVAAFTAHDTTSEPFSVVNEGPVLAPSSSPVIALEFETPPLDTGTYQVLWLSQHRLTLPVSATASRAIITAVDIIQVDHCRDDFARSFNGAATFQRKKGERLRVQLSIAKVGAGAVSAEMTAARFILDKLS